MLKIKETVKKVLQKIKPSKKEIFQEKKIVKELIEKIRATKGKHTDVVLAGSISRETNLKGDKDIDLFVMFDENTPEEEFEKEGLRIGKSVFRGHFWEKAFSQHPYIRGNINGYDIEIVPSYKVNDPQKIKSAVDRTPFHTEYLKEKLTQKQKDEVRLLRQFLKGIKAYGAELKTSSVPGYVTELLIIKYGSFEKTIKAISKWEEKQVIDLENHYPQSLAAKKFSTPLIVIDPIDKNRNVAAALSLNQFARIIAASRAFIKKPSQNYFFGKKTKTLPLNTVKKHLKKEGLIILETGYPKALADILWGQIKRLHKKLDMALEKEDFSVLRSSAWTDEKKSVIFVFDLKSNTLEKAMKRTGPPVTDEKNSEKFLKFHKNPLSGPRIENGKWTVEIERKNFDAKKFLKKTILHLKKTEKENIKKALNKKARILNEKEVLNKYKKEQEFCGYFSEYLKGKEEFEEY